MEDRNVQPDNWFTRLCHRSGKALRQVAKPASANRRVVGVQREERSLNESTVLRRTTIDEIEIRREPKDS